MKFFEYKGNEPDDWCMLTSQIVFKIAKEAGCILGKSLGSKVHDAYLLNCDLAWIRRRDYDAIQTLRKCIKDDGFMYIGPGTSIFPGDDPDIVEEPA